MEEGDWRQEAGSMILQKNHETDFSLREASDALFVVIYLFTYMASHARSRGLAPSLPPEEIDWEQLVGNFGEKTLSISA